MSPARRTTTCPPRSCEELAAAGLDPRARVRRGRRRAWRRTCPAARTSPAPPPSPPTPAASPTSAPASRGRRRARRRRAGLPLRDGLRRRGHRPRARRHPRRARRRRDARRGPVRGPAHRRAHRAELRLPPLRGRHRDRGLGRRPGRHPRPGARHPQDRCPGCRALQKYAVRCGGGVNHRFSLSDRAWSRTTTSSPAGEWCPPIEAVRAAHPDLRVEVEVTDLDQLRELLEAGCDRDPARQHVHRRRWPRRCGSPPAGPRWRPRAG